MTETYGRVAFTPSEAAEILGVDRGLIYRLIVAKKIDVIKIGASRIVPASSLGPEVLAGLTELRKSGSREEARANV